MASVLIVDDEPLIRWSLGETLEAAGHSVREAGSAAEALRFFEPGAEPIGAVVLDLKLPDSSDLGLLRRIRQLAPACRIILITAHGTPEVLEEARKSGVSGVLTKPFDMSCVVPLVDDSAQA
ncbi:MAG TPA: response regulator [Vicinamibacterales bacterium]|nr:response regulator [Vicinamibacterales bacterium]